MPKLYLTRGLPGSGKSTIAKVWVEGNPEGRVRVNRDGIRWTQGIRGGVGTREQERVVSLIEKATAVAALEDGKDVIVDATNLNQRFVREWFKLGYDVEFIDVKVPIVEAVRRDLQRSIEGGRYVGEEVIRRMARKAGVTEEGALPAPPKWTPKPKPDLTPIAAWDDMLPTVIIVDTDGTLANHEGIRNPYDTSKYMDDGVHENVAAIVRCLADTHYVIGVSGRDAAFADVTRAWWTEAARIKPDELHFRPEGDRRPDDVIKAEIYEQHIRGRYNVVGVFDDRGRVLRMWRAKGFTTFAVGDTDNYNF